MSELAGLLGGDLRIDKLELLLGKQLWNKKTEPKGLWEERGNQYFMYCVPRICADSML